MTRVEYGLIAVLGVLIVATLASTPDLSERNVEFIPDMVRSPAYETQSSNPVFADGMTQQAPPDQTIPRGLMPLHSGGVLLDTVTDWEKLQPEQKAAWNALAAPAELQQPDPRGERLFNAFCSPCHGAGAAGDGLVTKRGVPPPPTLLSDANKAISDGRMYRAITCGKGNMPTYAAQVKRTDRWKVITYIRSLQGR